MILGDSLNSRRNSLKIRARRLDLARGFAWPRIFGNSLVCIREHDASICSVRGDIIWPDGSPP